MENSKETYSNYISIIKDVLLSFKLVKVLYFKNQFDNVINIMFHFNYSFNDENHNYFYVPEFNSYSSIKEEINKQDYLSKIIYVIHNFHCNSIHERHCFHIAFLRIKGDINLYSYFRDLCKIKELIINDLDLNKDKYFSDIIEMQIEKDVDNIINLYFNDGINFNYLKEKYFKILKQKRCKLLLS